MSGKVYGKVDQGEDIAWFGVTLADGGISYVKVPLKKSFSELIEAVVAVCQLEGIEAQDFNWLGAPDYHILTSNPANLRPEKEA